MSYKPLRILVAYDNAGGRVGKVVPRMKVLLEERAFEVDTLELTGQEASGGLDLSPYRGVVVGTPVRSLGAKGPSEKVSRFLKEAPGLEDTRVATFCVFTTTPGRTLETMRELVGERGSAFVGEHAYWYFRPEQGEIVVPAECMVRVR